MFTLIIWLTAALLLMDWCWSHLSFYDRLCKDPFPRGAISNFLQYDWSIVTKDDDYWPITLQESRNSTSWKRIFAKTIIKSIAWWSPNVQLSMVSELPRISWNSEGCEHYYSLHYATNFGWSEWKSETPNCPNFQSKSVEQLKVSSGSWNRSQPWTVPKQQTMSQFYQLRRDSRVYRLCCVVMSYLFPV